MADRATFAPRFTLTILYLAGFVWLWAMVLVLPELMDAAARVPADAPAEAGNRAVAEAAREALRGRIPTAVLGALVSMGALLWLRWLPGLRPSS